MCEISLKISEVAERLPVLINLTLKSSFICKRVKEMKGHHGVERESINRAYNKERNRARVICSSTARFY